MPTYESADNDFQRAAEADTATAFMDEVNSSRDQEANERRFKSGSIGGNEYFSGRNYEAYFDGYHPELAEKAQGEQPIGEQNFAPPEEKEGGGVFAVLGDLAEGAWDHLVDDPLDLVADVAIGAATVVGLAALSAVCPPAGAAAIYAGIGCMGYETWQHGGEVLHDIDLVANQEGTPEEIAEAHAGLRKLGAMALDLGATAGGGIAAITTSTGAAAVDAIVTAARRRKLTSAFESEKAAAVPEAVAVSREPSNGLRPLNDKIQADMAAMAMRPPFRYRSRDTRSFGNEVIEIKKLDKPRLIQTEDGIYKAQKGDLLIKVDGNVGVASPEGLNETLRPLIDGRNAVGIGAFYSALSLPDRTTNKSN